MSRSKGISGGESSNPIQGPSTPEQKAVAKEAKGIVNWIKRQLGKLSESLGKWRTGKSDTCGRMREQKLTPIKHETTSTGEELQKAKKAAVERGEKMDDVAKKAGKAEEHAADFADLARKLNQQWTTQANTGCFSRLGKALFG